MSAQNLFRENVFHPKGEKGKLSFCRVCQKKPHYCNALKCRPDIMGCLQYFWEDGKMLKWFIPFSEEELRRGKLYTTDEYCIKYYSKGKPTQ